jgi:hypothetical protein
MLLAGDAADSVVEVKRTLDEPIDIEMLGRLVKAERERRGRLSLRAAADKPKCRSTPWRASRKATCPTWRTSADSWTGSASRRNGSSNRRKSGPRTRPNSSPTTSRDPNLTDAAAEKIAGLVRELYTNLVGVDRGVRVHLRAAATCNPEASRKLAGLLE